MNYQLRLKRLAKNWLGLLKIDAKELSVNLNFDSDKFKELISYFVNNDLQLIINEKLKQFFNQCIEVK